MANGGGGDDAYVVDFLGGHGEVTVNDAKGIGNDHYIIMGNDKMKVEDGPGDFT